MITRKIEILSWDVPFERLPADILALLSNQDQEAYRNGGKYFKEAALQIGESGLCEVLNCLDDNHPTRVYLDKDDDSPWLSWFGFTFFAERRHVCFRPAQQFVQLPPSTPDRLRRFYAHLGGLNDERGGDNGILPPERIRRVSDSDHHFVDDLGELASECWMFHSFGNGDYTCWHESGRGFLLNHEEESLDELILDEFLDDYFRFGILNIDRPE